MGRAPRPPRRGAAWGPPAAVRLVLAAALASATGAARARETAPAVAQEDDGAVALGGLGPVLHLDPAWRLDPAGTGPARLRARDSQGRLLEVWATPWRLDLSDPPTGALEPPATGALQAPATDGPPPAPAALATHLARELARQSGATVTALHTRPSSPGGRPGMRTALQLALAGGQGAALIDSFADSGHTVHLRLVGGTPAPSDLVAPLDRVGARLVSQHPPPPAGPQTLQATGLALPLPPGWRRPIGDETDAVADILTGLQLPTLPPWPADGGLPAGCDLGLHPHPTGLPALLLACPSDHALPPLDAASAAAVGATLHRQLFGPGAAVPPALPVPFGDRLGLRFSPPAPALSATLVLAPNRSAAVQLWALGPPGDAPLLDATLAAVLPALRFTGPDGGAHTVPWAQALAHRLRHHPATLWPAGLVLLLGAVALGARRRRRSPPVAERDQAEGEGPAR